MYHIQSKFKWCCNDGTLMRHNHKCDVANLKKDVARRKCETFWMGRPRLGNCGTTLELRIAALPSSVPKSINKLVSEYCLVAQHLELDCAFPSFLISSFLYSRPWIFEKEKEPDESWSKFSLRNSNIFYVLKKNVWNNCRVSRLFVYLSVSLCFNRVRYQDVFFKSNFSASCSVSFKWGCFAL